jgi:glycogen operon protein
VTYQEKHNQDNGEENRDGDNQNHSDHHGVEGPTDQPEIVALRSRQIKNLMATTLLSQGVPMVVAGDECRRTQQGNNNAYCQDNEISWFDWKRVEDHADLVRFFRSLVAFRRQQLTVRRTEFLTGETSPSTGMPDVGWFSPQGETVDWNAGSGALTCFLAAPSRQDDCSGVARSILMMANATDQSECFVTPGQLEILPWQLFLDTAAEAPKDIYPRLDGPALSESLELTHKSLRVYVA